MEFTLNWVGDRDGNCGGNCGGITNSYNTTNSYNNIVNENKIITDENQEIMKWLSPLDPRGRHHDVRTDRVDDVGSWLLETDEFREWRNNEGGANKDVLFCYGNPGVGKTYLRCVLVVLEEVGIIADS